MILSIVILAKTYRGAALEICLRILPPNFVVAQNYFKHGSKNIITTKNSRCSSLILSTSNYEKSRVTYAD